MAVISDCRKTSIVDKNGVSLIACSVGFASCKTFGKQPKHPCFGAKPPDRSSAICATALCSGFVWLTASILAWSRGGSPTLSPGMDAGRVCQRALQGRKANQAYTAFHGERGFRQGCRNKDTPSFARGKAIRVS